jgi:hypothetical protein
MLLALPSSNGKFFYVFQQQIRKPFLRVTNYRRVNGDPYDGHGSKEVSITGLGTGCKRVVSYMIGRIHGRDYNDQWTVNLVCLIDAADMAGEKKPRYR